MIEVKSLGEFIDAINKLEKKEYFFRGEDRLFETRSPSLFQYPNLLENADIYYNRLIAELPNADDKTPFETLSRLQHYGAKTRMLDITSNPLIALFFSSLSNNEDGFVYVYESEILKFEAGHTAILKAAINFIPNVIIRNFMKEINEDIFMSKLNEVSGLKNITYDKANEIREDLKRAHIIIAKKQTSRIRRQNGNFIMPAYEIEEGIVNKSIEDLAAKNAKNHPIVFRISKSDKKTILRDLSILGIHEGSVYPDVENQTKYLIKFFDDFPVEIDNSDENQIKKEIMSQYSNGQVLFSHINIFEDYSELNYEQKEFLRRFHTQDATLINEKDNYFAGIRADHFVVEVGYSEAPYGDERFFKDYQELRYALITANHKGDRVMTAVRLKDKSCRNDRIKPTGIIDSLL